MKKAVSNPNDTNLCYIARKQVAEWTQKGYDSDKIDSQCADIVKKAEKASK